MKRIISTALVAAIAVLALASIASANVVVNSDGTGFVAKGDVQTALKMNSSDFDKGKFAFTGTVSQTKTYPMTCATRDLTSVVSAKQTETRSGLTQAINATPVLSSNGKQITGWNPSGVTGEVSGTGSATVYGGGCPTGYRTIGIGAPVTTTSASALHVNGVDLPVTPVV